MTAPEIRGAVVLHVDAEAYDRETLARLRRSVGALRLARPGQLAEELDRHLVHTLFVGLGTAVDCTVLGRAPRLACVVTPTTSVNHLDMAALDAAGVTVLSLQGRPELLADITATAEHTWALVLSLRRRLGPATEVVARGGWERSGLLGAELRGGTFGILGLGRIGAAVGRVAAAFGMDVLYTDVRDQPAAADIPAFRVELPDLFSRSDVVSVHLTLSDATRGIVNASLLDQMRPGATLVNAAQGELVDEPALAAAVRAGRISAALDVLAGDSRWTATPPDHPLLELARTSDEMLLTPHIGGFSDRSVALVRGRLTDVYLGWLAEQEAT